MLVQSNIMKKMIRKPVLTDRQIQNNHPINFMQITVNQWRPFTMLVNARLLFISVDGLHYRSGGQVILTVSLQHRIHLFNRPRDTLSHRDRTRPNKTFIIKIKFQFGSLNFFTRYMYLGFEFKRLQFQICLIETNTKIESQ